ncbi:MAG: alpha/beta fold hydrolase [Jiangellaceae bacterium]
MIALTASGLAVRVDGSGPPVVLLHSGVTDHTSWDAAAAALAPSRTVIRHDLRGFGASPPPATGFRHLDDLVEVLQHLDVEAAAFAGNSFGGKLALDFASAFPDRVTALVMLAAPIAGWDWSADVRAYFDAEEEALEVGDVDAAVRLNLDMWVRGPVREWSPSLRALAAAVEPSMRTALANQTTVDEFELDDEHPPAAERLGDVTIPTLVGVGDRDAPDFVTIARHLVAGIGAAEFVEFPGAGHLIPVEQPEAVAACLTRFLRDR